MYEFLEETVERNMTCPAKAVAPETTVGDLLRLFAVDDLGSAAKSWWVSCPRPMP